METKKRLLFESCQAGMWSGLLVGIILAFGESLAVLFSAGAFLADWAFYFKALIMNGLAGALLGGLFAPGLLGLGRRVFKSHSNDAALFFPLYLAGGLFAEIILYLLDTDSYGGRNKGSLRTLGLIGLIAAACLLVAVLLRFWIKRLMRQKRKALFSPRWSLSKLVAIFGLFICLGFLFWGFRRVSIAGEGKLIMAKKAAGTAVGPNGILLVVDSLRADHLSTFGYPAETTPAIDRLAREGAAFSAAVAASSWTLPAHASLFTGLYPWSHGAYSAFSVLGAECQTLAAILARAGYYTLSVYANPLLGSAAELDRGFDLALGVGNRQKTSLTIERLYKKISGGGSTSGEILDISLRWIDHCHDLGIPCFIFMNILEAHAPYRPKEPYFREFCRGLPMEKVHWSLIRQIVDARKSRQEESLALSQFQEADFGVLAGLYDSNIRFIDQQIKTWTKALQDRGVLDKTLLALTSDHGEFLGEHGQIGHGTGRLYDSVLRIPLIFRYPRSVAAIRESRAVSQVDIMPSILFLLGLSDRIPSGIQGLSLFPAAVSRAVLSEYWDERRRTSAFALTWESLKLIQEGQERVELYDLAVDPREKTNLIGSRPEDGARLARELKSLQGTLEPRQTRLEEKKRKEIERLLKSLGYTR